MNTAVKDSRALVVTSQPQMLEKLEHSEVGALLYINTGHVIGFFQ